MFPLTLAGQVRAPESVGPLAPDDAAVRIAEYLCTLDATEVEVRGSEVTFRVRHLPFTRVYGARLQPVDAGGLHVREEGGRLVLAYRLRMRRNVVEGLVFSSVVAMLALDPEWKIAAFVGMVALVLLETVLLTHRRFPKRFLEGLAFTAFPRAGSAPAVAPPQP